MFITDDIRYVGVNDHQVDLFEGQYVVPNGMSYNSYVILDEKVAVMDTILSGKYDDYKRASSRLLDISDSTLWNADEPKDPTHSRGFEDMFN